MLQLACPAAAPGREGQPGRPRTHTGTRNNPVHKNLHYPVQCNTYTKNSANILSYKNIDQRVYCIVFAPENELAAISALVSVSVQ